MRQKAVARCTSGPGGQTSAFSSPEEDGSATSSRPNLRATRTKESANVSAALSGSKPESSPSTQSTQSNGSPGNSHGSELRSSTQRQRSPGARQTANQKNSVASTAQKSGSEGNESIQYVSKGGVKRRFQAECWECKQGRFKQWSFGLVQCRSDKRHVGPDWHEDPRSTAKLQSSTNSDACQTCGEPNKCDDENGKDAGMVICGNERQGCGLGYHRTCLGIEMDEETTEWFCPTCQNKGREGSEKMPPERLQLAARTLLNLTNVEFSAQQENEPGNRVTREASDGPEQGGASKKQRTDGAKAPTVLDGGIVIHGGRVMMKGGAAPPKSEPPAECTYCKRPFVSTHALDVHLSRNQGCRVAHEQKKSIGNFYAGTSLSPAAPQMMSPKTDPKPGALSKTEDISTMDICQGLISQVASMPGAKLLESETAKSSKAKDNRFSGDVLQELNPKIEESCFVSVHDFHEAVLKFFRDACRYNTDAGVHAAVSEMAQEFEKQFEHNTNYIRGCGGLADALYFKHGAGWLNTKVKVYWPELKKRVYGVINAHHQVDQDTHIYRIEYSDEHIEGQWTTLPHPKVELIEWVKPHQEKLVDASAIEIPRTGQIKVQEPILSANSNSEKKRPRTSLAEELPDISASAANSKKESPAAAASVKGGLSITCNAFKEGQRVEAVHKSSKTILPASIIDAQANRLYAVEFLAFPGDLMKDVPESELWCKEGRISHVELLVLVQELMRKSRYEFFDHPVDDRQVQKYYHANPAAKQRGITAWNTQSMCFSWMEKKAQERKYPDVSAVEFDFNLIVNNAVIFNPHNHVINREARVLFQSAKHIFSKWSRKPGCYSCKACEGVESNSVPILLCDHCCRGIHQACFLQSSASKAIYMWSQEVRHPFRGDTAFFCSEDCYKTYKSVIEKFNIPKSSKGVFDMSGADANDHIDYLLPEDHGYKPKTTNSSHSSFSVASLPLQSKARPESSTSVASSTKSSGKLRSAAAVGKASVPSQHTPAAVLSHSKAQVMDTKAVSSALKALKTSREEKKVKETQFDTLHTQLQNAIVAQQVTPAMMQEVYLACGRYEQASVNAASAQEQYFQAQSKSSVSTSTPKDTEKIQKIKNVKSAFKKYWDSWSVESKASVNFQARQDALNQCIANEEDPSDEMIEAADKACEEYERRQSETIKLQEKYLALLAKST